ncbi:sensor domain-containing diguanylate cyclase [Shewanella gaetbuli]|uniref:diguanylate cyclase n=1 Tax=Shewanella gaetbuli TaxID=220752 RepID=A0A9X1ZHJ9_9GAMM|nr:GGDEF domain-containing protein [Shewanella gaetbuli]
MFDHLKDIRQSKFTNWRYAHYQIYQIMLPYSPFLLSVIPVYLLFIIADIDHLQQGLATVIAIRLMLSISAVVMLVVLIKYKPKYLAMGEMILVLGVYFSLIYIGDLAISQGDYYYQSGGILVFFYLAALSRMPFIISSIMATIMIVAYSVVLFPAKYQFNAAAEIDALSIHLALYLVTIMACLRRDTETYRSYVQYRKIRNQQLALKKNQTILSIQNQTDSLTGVKNRLYLSGTVFHQINSQTQCAVLMLDIDNFKSINDTYGHPVGDKVIKAVASVLKHVCANENGVAVRYGGEEFVVVLFEYSLDDAQRVAEDIRAQVEKWLFAPEQFKVTISIGIAVKQLTDTQHYQLIEQADAALYQAKKAGKNQVCHYQR